MASRMLVISRSLLDRISEKTGRTERGAEDITDGSSRYSEGIFASS